MFPTLGLFQRIPCPERSSCKRPNCIFSHDPNTVQPPAVRIPVDSPLPSASPSTSTPSSSNTATPVRMPPTAPSKVVTKRPIDSTVSSVASGSGGVTRSTDEPPKKLQRVGTLQKPVAIPTATTTSSGVPILRVNAAQSQVPIPVRQASAMMKTLYDHFVVLYEHILPHNPTVAAEHTLKQEEEVYKSATKTTYRNAVLTSVAALKRRPKPDSMSHPSVGSQGDIVKREEDKKKLEALRLAPSHLKPYILTLEQMNAFGYITEIPLGEGGSRPSEEGGIQKCERCRQQFQVKRKEGADECRYHWGKKYTTKKDGERRRIWTCCSKADDDPGTCTTGPHVFYESDPENLHRRHAFSHTRPAASHGKDTALDIVALDCEMIYSTGGMRVARVSVVDSAGKEIYDEFVRMDDGVEVIDLNTRFSGITEEDYAAAVLPLASIRTSLDAFINEETIIIGHALENDLKTLRMIHHRCVDTAIMFPHRAGPPYRRSLRDLVKEHLGKTIQTGGGTTGHSSVEDSIATLDLVRWHVLNGPKPKPKPPPVPLAPAPEATTVTTASTSNLSLDIGW
ncbi:Rexo1 protein [Cristinia sonorae]|uniref:Rexo1 protein n=1 Tax=Cristinia sonorae TaxID=1940300 RepID=A0A8K0UWS3_9AGAR|nr:Rexo1 protein [Cristinia sonorae]